MKKDKEFPHGDDVTTPYVAPEAAPIPEAALIPEAAATHSDAIARVRTALEGKTRGKGEHIGIAADDVVALCDAAPAVDQITSDMRKGCAQAPGKDVVVMADQLFEILDKVKDA